MNIRDHLDRTDLVWLLAVSLTAFIGFHLTVEINSSLWFRVLTFQQNDWLNILVGVWALDPWTIGICAYFGFLAFQKRSANALVFAILTIMSYWTYKYPLVTAFLVELGQFERIGPFFLDQRAPLVEVIEASR